MKRRPIRNLPARYFPVFALFFTFFILKTEAVLFAGGWAQPKSGLFAKLYYLSSTAASYREPDGRETVSFRDTLAARSFRNYATSFSGYGIGLYAEYGITRDITFSLDVPLNNFALEELYSIDDQHPDYEIRRKAVITQLSWAGIGVRWQPLLTDNFVGSVTGCVRIPPGFSSPDTGRVDFPFLSDGTVQVSTGLELGYSYETGWLEAEARYNHRAGEFSDEVNLHLETGFSSIPRTYLKLFGDGTISTTTPDVNSPFNVMQSQLQETYYNFGGSFMVFVTSQWFIEASYTVRLYGYNTWTLNTLTLGGGIKLPGVN